MFDGVVESLLTAFIPFATTGLILRLGFGVFSGFLGKLFCLGIVQASFEFAGKLSSNLVLQI